ncbi:MAG: NRDE family protein [Planctomycetes bacterium]|nr:NRDE family protein [Planctomycetota bacterium]MCC7170735.1 NRDE family protein [Planctomycetota bacterium]
MCSVTWIRDDAGLHVFMNRDERRSRAPERPPRVFSRDGVRRIAPEDGAAGGTWIAANEHGLVVLLVNGYLRDDAERTDEPRSRGRLVDEMAAARSSLELATALRASDLRPYRSFRMLALHPEDEGCVATWDAHTLDVVDGADAHCPLLSSSHASSAVAAARLSTWHECLAERGRDVGLLERYHASHARGPSAFSVCMHRDDAETRSFVRVRVDARTVWLTWSPGSPCRALPSTECELPRVAAP